VAEGGGAAGRQSASAAELAVNSSCLVIFRLHRNWTNEAQLEAPSPRLSDDFGGGFGERMGTWGWEIAFQLHKITYIHCSLHLQFVPFAFLVLGVLF